MKHALSEMKETQLAVDVNIAENMVKLGYHVLPSLEVDTLRLLVPEDVWSELCEKINREAKMQ